MTSLAEHIENKKIELRLTEWERKQADVLARSLVQKILEGMPKKKGGNPDVSGDDGNAYDVGFDEGIDAARAPLEKFLHE